MNGVKEFLTLTFFGMLLAGFCLGTLIEGTDAPTRQATLLGAGLWVTLVGVVGFPPER